jgi:hypothetical protein
MPPMLNTYISITLSYSSQRKLSILKKFKQFFNTTGYFPAVDCNAALK